jgi:hypothetical protein
MLSTKAIVFEVRVNIEVVEIYAAVVIVERRLPRHPPIRIVPTASDGVVAVAWMPRGVVGVPLVPTWIPECLDTGALIVSIKCR